MTHDKTLSNNLSPRNSIDIFHKMSKNVFCYKTDVLIAAAISGFNHSCIPDAIVISIVINRARHKMVFLCVYTLSDLDVDQEVRISYGECTHRPKGFFCCPCKFSLEERSHKMQTNNKLGEHFAKDCISSIDAIIHEYISSSRARACTIAHKLASDGIYIGKTIGVSPRFNISFPNTSPYDHIAYIDNIGLQL